MKVLVTGGSGHLGKWTVEDLRQDNEVTVIGRRIVDMPEGVRMLQADHTDLGQVYSAMAGMDAVVHLAAIRSPMLQTPEVVFGSNIMGTFHITEAAGNLGVKKLIYSSSCSAYGFAFSTEKIIPDYLPIDEAHPMRPQDPYGLSKWLGEEILETATRRTGMTTVVMRIPIVLTPDRYADLVPLLLVRPKLPGIGAWVDARDFAQAVRLALESEELAGHERFIIAAEDSLSPTPLCESFPAAYPGSEQMAAKLTGTQSSVSIEKAKRMLGYQPSYGWRHMLES